MIATETLNPNRNMMAGTMASHASDPRALAAQIDPIAHPAVCGTPDLGHGWLAAGRLGFDWLAAVRDGAPYVGHLHATDKCGLPITCMGATEDEHVASGMRDPHLPIGRRSMPYDALLADRPVRPGSAAPRHRAGDEPGRIADRLTF